MPPVWDVKHQYSDINQDHVLKIINHDSCALCQYFFTHHICDISQLCVVDDKSISRNNGHNICQSILYLLECKRISENKWNATKIWKCKECQILCTSEDLVFVKYCTLWNNICQKYFVLVGNIEIIFVKNILYLLECKSTAASHSWASVAFLLTDWVRRTRRKVKIQIILAAVSNPRLKWMPTKHKVQQTWSW